MRDIKFSGAAASIASRADHPVPGKATLTEQIYRRASGASSDVAPDALASLGGASGAPLPGDARARFEASAGADLSDVRVHTGPASVSAAEQLGARAFTTGRDIHFGAGQYQPTDPAGTHLLAHEVAHTVQQQGGAGRPQMKLEVSEPGDAAEVAADRFADHIVHGGAAPALSSVPAGVIHRTPVAPSYGGVTGVRDLSKLANRGQVYGACTWGYAATSAGAVTMMPRSVHPGPSDQFTEAKTAWNAWQARQPAATAPSRAP